MKLIIAVLGGIALACVLILFVVSEPEDNEASQASENSDDPAPTPLTAPLYPTIAAAYLDMTDVQQDRYLESLAGMEAVKWDGLVEDVTETLGDFTVFVDSGRETAGHDVVLWDVDEDTAVSLNIGDRVVFSGKVREVSDSLFGLTATIENTTIHEVRGD